MTPNDSKSYLPYLNKLVDQYNNNYYHFINTKPIKADCSVLSEKIVTNPEASEFKVSNRVSISKYNNIFSNYYPENWSREIFIINSVLKTNSWTFEIDLNGEKMIEKFYEKELLRSKV